MFLHKSFVFKSQCVCFPLRKFVFSLKSVKFLQEIVSGYVCNHGSPSGERDTAYPRGRYGERLQRDSCLKIHM